MKLFGLVTLGVILGLIISIGLAVLYVFMFIWNISDIQNVGPNFWNIFWLVIASIGSLTLLAGIFQRK